MMVKGSAFLPFAGLPAGGVVPFWARAAPVRLEQASRPSVTVVVVQSALRHGRAGTRPFPLSSPAIRLSVSQHGQPVNPAVLERVVPIVHAVGATLTSKPAPTQGRRI